MYKESPCMLITNIAYIMKKIGLQQLNSNIPTLIIVLCFTIYTSNLVEAKEITTDMCSYHLSNSKDNNFSLSNISTAARSNGTDTDNDGIDDCDDLDDDNDGITDADEGCPDCNLGPFINGNFEQPASFPASGSFSTMNANTVPGWQVTDSQNRIELWSNNYNGVPAYSGNYFAEINANENGALYQRVCTLPGSVFNWSVAHRGRAGTDRAVVKIGATVASAPVVQNMTTGLNWVVYSGTYTVPANQASTFFIFEAVSTASGNASIGNFVDDIQITLVQQGSCPDFDNDGIPNTLDLDSDNDGCLDAEEGGGNFSILGGTIRNGTLVGTVSGNGIPQIANGGQSVGNSQNANRASCPCPFAEGIDTDGDGLDNYCDTDDDNDGILDLDECGSPIIQETPFFVRDGNTVNFSLPATGDGFVLDVTSLDNSFNIVVNGTTLTTNEIEFQTDQMANIRFQDGSQYGINGIPEIYQFGTANPQTPLLRFVIDRNRNVSMFGSKVLNGPLFPLALVGNSVNNFTWNTNSVNNFVVGQTVVGVTYIRGRVYGTGFSCADLDGDGLINSLDNDSDNDGCPDAIEGTQNFTQANINGLSQLSGAVNGNGVPNVANGGQGVGLSQNPTQPNLLCNASCRPSDMSRECTGVNENRAAADSWNATNINFLQSCISNSCARVTVSSNYSFTNLSNLCGNTGAIVVTYTITDDCGNTAQLNATFRIVDSTRPTITQAQDRTVECNGNGNTTQLNNWLNSNAGATDSDVCGNVRWSNNFSSLSDRCGETGHRTVTFTATDDCGNTSQTSATFTIEDTTSPDITQAQNQTVECDGSGNTTQLNNWLNSSAGATTSDVCGTVSWSHNFITLTDDCGTTGNALVTFTATDDCGNTSQTSATFTIEDTTSPSITQAQNQTVECDGSGNTTQLNNWLNSNAGATASDICGTVSWTNNFTTLSDDCGTTGNALVTFTATDDCGNTSQTSATFTIEDTTSPSITQAQNQTVECDGNGNQTQLNNWLNSNAGATASDVCGTVSWTHNFTTLSDDCGATGSTTVTFTATDNCGNTSQTSATFTIEDTTSPDITQAQNQTVECDGSGNTTQLNNWLNSNAGATASDICGTVSWTNNFTTLSDDCGTTGNALVTFTATDDCGNTSQTSATFTIEDTTSPDITQAQNQTVECDGNGNTTQLNNWLDSNAGATASDICSNVIWTHNYVTLSDNCGTTGSATVTFTATDDCGNTSQTSATFTIEDTTSPDITQAQNLTVECDGQGNQNELNDWLESNAGATDSDICGDVTWTNNFTSLSDDCGATGSAMVTFTATDECGNTSQTIATFTIEDNTPPDIGNCSYTNLDCDYNCSSEAYLFQGNPSSLFAIDLSTGNSYPLGDMSIAVNAVGYNPTDGFLWGLTGGDNPLVRINRDLSFTAFSIPNLIPTYIGDINTEGKYASIRGSDITIVDLDPNSPTYLSIINSCKIAVTSEADVAFCPIDNNLYIIERSTNNLIRLNIDNCRSLDLGPITGMPPNTTGFGAFFMDNEGNLYISKNSDGHIYKIDQPHTGNTSASLFSVGPMSGVNDGAKCPFSDVYLGNDLTVECDGNGNTTELNDWLNANAGATASDICGGVTWSNDFTSLSDDCGATGSATVTFTATDDCGNTAQTTATFTIIDTTSPDITQAQDLTVECDGNGNTTELNQWLNSNAGATASDICGGVTWTHNFSVLSNNCGATGEALVTFTATDDCGNTSQTSATFTIIDTTSPDITQAQDLTVECDGNGNTTELNNWLDSNASATASDICGAVVWTHNFITLSDDCGTTGNALVTFTATDDCGNTSQTSATFIIEDTTSPDITQAQNLTVECDGNGNNTELNNWLDSNASATASDICGAVVWTHNFTTLSDDCGATGEATVTFTATDECGNTSQTTATFNIEDMTSPDITQAQDLTVECNGNGNTTELNQWLNSNAAATASDICGAVVWTHNFTTLSDDCGATGEATVTFTATDECGNTSQTTATFNIEDTTSPDITQAQDLTVECDGNGNISELNQWLNSNAGATASDICGNVAWSNNFTSLSNDCGATGETLVTFTATDECGNTAQTSATFTIIDTTPPDVTQAQDLTVECDGNGNITELNNWLNSNAGATASDICGDVSWSNDFTNLSDDCGATGEATVNFTATDECGNTAQTSATFTIEDTTPPDVTDAQDLTVECDGNGNITELNNWLDTNAGAIDSDICGDVTWTNNFSTLSDDCGATGSATVTFTATDECGNTSQTIATFTIEDTTSPDITQAQDLTVECDGNGNTTELNQWLNSNAGATASDICGNVTWSNNFTNLSDECGATGEALVTFTATDDCGNTAQTIATFTIEDTTSPDITQAQDLTVECDGNGNQTELNQWLDSNASATASDICGNVTWSNNFTNLSDDCDATGEALVTFTATDECGNTSQTSATFTIEDTTPPNIVEEAQDITVECDGNGNIADLNQWLNANANATANDICGNVTWSNDFTNLSDECGATGAATVIFTATDDCGNTNQTSATFTIEDTTPPDVTDAQDLTVECDGNGNTTELNNWLDTNAGAIDSDICGDVTWANDFTSLSDDCGATGEVTVTFTATDECDNTAQTSATFTIEDTTPPEITDAQDLTVECDGNGNLTELNEWINSNAGATASDICGSVSWSSEFSEHSDECGQTGIVTATFTATDDCGNTAQTMATFTIEDTTPPEITNAQDLTVECDGNGNQTELNDWLDSNAGATASDICGNVSWSNDFSSLSDDCGATGEALVTFTATDECGNTSQTSATFTIEDTTAPDITDAQDITVECDGNGNIADLNQWLNSNAGATANDICGDVSWSNNFSSLSDECGATGEALVTFTATDECGNTSQTSATFTIEDTTPPEITDAQNITVECDGNGNIADLNQWLNSNAGATANDICGDVSWSNNFSSLSDECGATGEALVTFTATDECGNTSQTSATFTIEDTTPPEITDAQNITVECDGNGNQEELENWINSNAGATASDICGGVTWSSEFSELSDECGATGIVTATFTATDDCGNTAQTTATFTIEDTTSPDITDAQDIIVECDGSGIQTELNDWLNSNAGATASDICGDISWSNDFSSLSDDCGATGEATVIFTATDECGNTSQTSATFTIEDTTAPDITEAQDLTVECDGSGNQIELNDWLDSNAGATASDICGDVTWSNDFNSLSDECGATGEATVTFTATDDCGNTAQTSATFTIEDTTAPDITDAQDITVECDGNGNIAEFNEWINSNAGATDSDICGDVTWSTDIPDFSDDCGETGSTTVTFTATDECGNTAQTMATFTIEDTTPPDITDAQDLTVECDGNGNQAELNEWIENNAGATATDICGGVTWSSDFTELSDECGETGIVTATFTATDDCGNTAQTSAIFTIEDTTPPDITEAEDITVECDGNGNLDELNDWISNNAGATASDICGGVTWSSEFSELSDECGQTGIVTATFTATDDCGNTAQTSATFTIEDTTAPDITDAQDLTVECDGSGNQTELNDWLDSNAGATASDICGDVTWSNDFNSLSDECGATGEATVTFTATDECGNTAQTSATFTIEDTTAPEITMEAQDITVECDGSGNIPEFNEWINNNGGAIANDICGDINWDTDFPNLSDECGATGSVTATFTATDECGNTDQTMATFTIEDTTAPDITDAQDLTVECDGNGNQTEFNEWINNNAGATANDICGDVTWSSDFGEFSDDCGETGSVTATFTATDECGNTAQTMATFTIEDTIAPDITEAQDLTVECDGNGNIDELNEWIENNAGATASDICGEVTWSSDVPDLSDDCGATGSTTVTFTATDDCGNTAQTTATFTIEDTTAPDITDAQDLTVECDGSGNQTELNEWLDSNAGATANDICGDVIWSNDFTSLSDECGATGEATVTFIATDECGNTAQTMATFIIEDTTPPEITEEAQDLTVECDGSGNIPEFNDWLDANGGAIAGDICGDIIWTNEYPELSDDCGETGSTTVTFIANDECGNTAQTMATFTIEDTTPPEITDAQDLTVECDGNGNQSEFNEWIENNAGATANDICGDVTWSSEFGELSDDCGETGMLTATFTATDECGNTAQTMATFTIEDTTPPEITEAQDLTVECDGNGNQAELEEWINSNAGATASDICGEVTWSSEVPDLSDECGATGSLTATFIATDECGNTAQTMATFTIEDTTPPEITEAQDLTVECDGNGNQTELNEWLDSNAGATADDLCGEIAWSNDFTSLSDECGATGEASVTFTATDECGNTAQTTATFIIEDTTPPEITEEAQDITVECDGDGNQTEFNEWLDTNGGAIAADICSELTWTNEYPELSDDCGATGATSVTFIATDECSNTAQTMATFTIEDTTPPEITGEEDITVECDGNGNQTELNDWIAENAGATANDLCGDITWTSEQEELSDECGATGAKSVTFTATDECGNTAQASASFTIEDTTPPEITGGNDLVLSCDADLDNEIQQWLDNNAGATTSDACGEVSWSNDFTAYDDICDATITVTFIITDDCGNSATHTKNINIYDDEAPSIEVPADITISCDEVLEEEDPIITDNCDTDIEIELTTEDLTEGCGGFIKTWTATDDCGNESQMSQTITITDSTPPTFSSTPEDVTVDLSNGDEIPDIPSIEAMDNCAENIDLQFTEEESSDGCLNIITRTWTATDECENTATLTQTVSVLSSLILTIEANDVALCDDNQTQISLSVENGEPPYTYDWTISNGTIEDPTVQNPMVSLENIGNFQAEVTVEDSKGCQAMGSVNISVTGSFNAQLLGDTTYCEAATIELSVQGGNNWQWEGPEGFSSTQQAISISDATLQMEGDYFVTVSDGAGACQVVLSREVSVERSLIINLNSNSPVCNYGDIYLYASGSSDLEFEWTGPEGMTSNEQNPVFQNIDLPIGSYIFEVNVFSPETECSAYASLEVEITEGSVYEYPENISICEGETLELNASGGIDYFWQGPDGYVSISPENTIDNITAAQAGDYVLNVITENLCFYEDTIVVGVISDNLEITGNQEVCLGGQLRLEVENYPNTKIQWTGPNGFTSNEDIIEIDNITEEQAGLYEVEIATANCSIQGSIEITLIGNSTNASYQVTDVSCATLGEIAVNIEEDTTNLLFTWGDLNAVNQPQNRFNLQEGTYALTITNEDGCETIFDEIIVPNNCGCIMGPVVLDTIIENTSCTMPDGQIEIQVEGDLNNYVFEWTPNVGTTQGQFDNHRGNLPEGTYTIKVADMNDASCATLLEDISIETLNGPQVELLSKTNTDCSGNIGSAEFSPSEYDYEWSDGGTGNSRNDLGEGSYIITFTDNTTDCSDTISVVIELDFTLEGEAIINQEPACGEANGSVQIEMTGGSGDYDFSWGDSAINEALEAGLHEVTITDLVSNCETELSFTLNNNVASGTITAEDSILLKCNDASLGNIDYELDLEAEFNGPANVSIENSEGTTFENGELPEGEFCIVVLDADDCIAIQHCFEVVAPETISATINSSDLSCTDDLMIISESGSIEIIIENGTAPFVFDWEDLEGTDNEQNRSNLEQGTYNLTITDANFCTLILDEIEIGAECVEPDGQCVEPEIIDIITTEPACGEENGTIELVLDDNSNYTFNWANGETTASIQDLAAGAYEVTISRVDEEDCSTVETIALSNLESTEIEITENNPSSCANDDGMVTLSPNSLSFTWNDGNSDASRNDLATGTYEVSSTDENGCLSVVVVEVLQDCEDDPSEPCIEPEIVDIITNEPACGEENGTIELVLDDNSNYTFTWANGETSANIQDLAAGAYEVTISRADEEDCITIETIALSNFESTEIEITENTPSSCADDDGSVTLSPNSLSFTWNDGNTDATRNDLAAGTYEVSSTDENECLSVIVVEVLQDCEDDPDEPCDDPEIVDIITSEPACGEENGTIELVLDDNSNYTFTWTNGETTANIQNLAAGTYDVTISRINKEDCFTVETIALSNFESTEIEITENKPSSCSDDDGAVSLSPNTLSFTWNDGNNDTSRNDLAAGIYEISATDENDCLSVIVVEILQDCEDDDPDDPCDEPTVNTINLSEPECGEANGVIELVLDNNDNYNFNWSNGETTPTLQNLEAGAYEVSISRVDDETCTTIENIALSNFESTEIEIIENNASSCLDNDGTITLGPNSLLYTWEDGTIAITRNNLSTGTYEITGTDGSNCQSIIVVEVLQDCDDDPSDSCDEPSIIDIVQTEPDCGATNGTIQLVLDDNANYNFLWANGETSSSIQNLEAGAYEVTISRSDEEDCFTIETIALSNFESTEIEITENSPSSCEDNDGVVTLSPNTLSFTWEDGNTEATRNDLAAGTYEVSATDENGCLSVIVVEVLQDCEDDPSDSCDEPSIIDIVQTEPDCGATNGTIELVLDDNANYNFTWANGETSSSIQNLEVGAYEVTISRIDEEDCFIIETIALSNFESPEIEITENNPSSCSDDDGMVTLSPASLAFVWNDGATAISRNDLTAGMYEVSATDENGCLSVVLVEVVQDCEDDDPNDSCDEPSVNDVVLTEPNCGATNGIIELVLDDNANYNFLWANGETSSTIQNLEAGAYEVTISRVDDENCLIIDNIALSNFESIEIEIVENSPSSCADDDGMVTLSPNTLSFIWNDGNTGVSRNDLTAGIYEVSATNENGCLSVIVVEVLQDCEDDPNDSCDEPIINNIALTEPDCGEANGAIELIAFDVANYTFNWSNGATTSSIQNLEAGAYEVTVSLVEDQNCFIVETIALSNFESTAIEILENSPSSCLDNDGIVTLGPITLLYTWSDGFTAISRSNLSAGTYEVTGTDGSNCQSIIVVEVLQDCEDDPTDPCDEPTITNIALTEPDCGATNGAIELILDDTSNYNFIWSNGETTPSIQNLEAGVYEVSISRSDEEDCTTIETIALSNFESTPIEILENNPSSCTDDDGFVSLSPNTLSFIWNDGATETNRNNLAAGIYSVTATDENDCLSVIVVEVVQECEDDPTDPCDEPTITNIALTEPDCGATNGAIELILDDTSNYNFIWSNGETTPSIQNLEAGVYEVSISRSDEEDCTTIETIALSNFESTPIEILENNPSSCTDNDGFVSLSPNTLSFMWNDGATESTRNDLAAGIYTVSATDQNECLSVIVVEVLQDCEDDPTDPCDEPSITNIAQTEPDCGTANGTIEVDLDDTSNYNFLWSNGASTPSIQNLEAGAYEVSISRTDEEDCTTIETIALSNLESTPIEILENNPSSCDDNDGFVSLSPTTLSFIWNDGNTETTRNDLAAGIYSVTATDQNECLSVIVVEVVQECEDVDTDGDGIPDHEDPDIDGDGISNEDDPDPNDPDIDDDGILDGDDPDIDDDGIPNDEDDHPGNPDADDDGLIDGIDPDPNDPDFDDDGILDGDDPDIDGDGIPNEDDPDPNDPNTPIPVGTCEIFTQDTIHLLYTCGEELASQCISLSLNEISLYEIIDNGLEYDKDIGTCEEGKVISSYSFITIPNFDANGPYAIDKWEINGRNNTGIVQDFDALVDSMDVWDELNIWITDETNNFIFSQGSIENNYSELVIRRLSDDLVYEIIPKSNLYYDEVTLYFDAGIHEVIIQDSTQTCADTAVFIVQCISDSTYLDININHDTSICFDHLELEIIDFCADEMEQNIETEINADLSCIEIEGIDIGIDTTCILVCNMEGICDTHHIITSVLPYPPIAMPDDTLGETNIPMVINILDNDTLNFGTVIDIFIDTTPLNGTVSVDTTDNTVLYTPDPDFCGSMDSFSYVLVTEMGQDTAMVYVDIPCSDLELFNGISPNGDGVNDVFFIRGIESYPENELMIFNRWGNQIYYKEKYSNTDPFDGTWNGKDLPDGTYFYILKLNDDDVLSGYLSINR